MPAHRESPVYRILVINPGSTSTKVAVYEDETLLASETLRHSAAELASFPHIADQYAFRQDAVLDFLRRQQIDPRSLSAVVGRGGLMRRPP
jgi:butyrate kinase